ncbi:DUF3048 domain-containing protein [bacterium]|nr:DUF3048 domain-containing protein [bacterium]OIO84570.1 MAG: hypothetical protein AUK01_08820 [Anaerolineae bacterium CG2_30_57_67]
MRLFFAIVFATLLMGCAPATEIGATPRPTDPATATAASTETPTPSLTPSPTLSLTPDYPPAGYGPDNFPANIDPLTGLKVADPSLLERRPLLIKISNLPRNVRPQWGLNAADQVFEYYTEEGTTRFAALFYGQDAAQVGPIRSARLVDHHLMTMYKANFAFGSADYRIRNLLYNQDYSDRLVIESACPPMCRYEPNGFNFLMADTATLTDWINEKRVPGGNGRQNLDGFAFNYRLPATGEKAEKIFVRFSAAIYNRWDYDPTTGKYIRFAETDNDLNGNNETYAPLTDRVTGDPIRADNVVVLYITHQYFSRHPEIVDIVVSGPSKAYLFRDGQMFALTWYRNGLDQRFTLADAQGKIFPLKPGNTWFEVIGATSALSGGAPDWRFTFSMP